MYKINELSQIILGRQGENKATTVEIDVSEWLAEYPTADINILVMRNGDTAPYIAVTSVANNVLSWVITVSDTQYSGRGKAEIRATVNDVVKKSATAVTYVAPSLEGEPSPTPPEPSQSWVNEVIAAKESIENMSATAEVDNNVGTPSVTVTKTIIDDHTNLDFDFKNLKGEKGDPGQVDIDQHYDPTSENAQSGTAVAEAVSTKQDKFGDISGNYIVTDKGIVFTDYVPKSDVAPENPGDLTTKSYVDTEIENHHDNTKADKSTTYTKTEVDTALGGKADKSTVDNHIADKSNPHEVTKSQVGLGNVDNTSDADKPISTATQTALDSKANASDVYTKIQTDTLLDNKENIIRDITPYVDYTVDSQTNEVTITNLKSGVSSNSLIGRFRIPDTITIDGVARTVTTIGGTCFYNCVNADFILPSTLTTIEDGTPTSSLPAYAHGAFSNTKITNANPNPNMYVGEGAFYNCDYITSLHIPYGVTLGNACFLGCNNIKKVVIDEGITNAGSNTFLNNTSLFELLLPETLTTMGNAVFSNTKLKTLYLPKSVTTMSSNAFSGVVLTDLYFGGTQTEFEAKSYRTIFTNMSGITIHYNCKSAIMQDIYDYHDSTKQDKLTAGTNITIDENNVISASGGGTVDQTYDPTSANAQSGTAVAEAVTALTGSTAPTTATVGYIGQFYIDTTNSKVYQCVTITPQGTTPETYTYTWQAPASFTPSMKTGTAVPTTATAADYIGQLYEATTSNGVLYFKCIAINNGTYTWKRIYLENATEGIVLGNDRSLQNGGIDIGQGKSISAGTPGRWSTCVGYANVCLSQFGVAIGGSVGANANNAIQLGSGTNSTANTFSVGFRNVGNYTMLNADGTIPFDRTTIRKTTLDNVLVPNANYDLGSTEQASVTLTLPTPSGTDNYSCNEIYVAFKSGSTATTLSIVGTYAGDTSYVPSANSICELSFKYVCGTWVLVAKDTALPSA